MDNEKSKRINDALVSLVDVLLPPELSYAERRDAAVEQARRTLASRPGPAEVSDVNHVSDLIKKKLWRENDAPDKAVQYSNLYSRLLTQPVLSQKWAILFLLHQLGDSQVMQPTEVLSLSPEERGSSQRLGTARQARGDVAIQDDSQPASRGTVSPTQFSKASTLDNVANGIDAHIEVQYQGQGGKPSEMALDPVSQTAASTAPSESALLRDLPFTLQGVSSTNLPFTSISTLCLPPTLPLPIISLLHTLAEPSLLYKSLSEFVDSRDEGLIGQSFRSAIGTELRSYMGLIATLEGEIRRAAKSLDPKEPRGGIGKAGVTLKRCTVWTREATMGLRLLSLMVEQSKSRKGGQLISMIHAFSTSHGDPFVGAFAERMLTHVTRPFYDMLRQWIYDGELSDPYHEFFVIERDQDGNGDRELDPRRAPATSVWEDKYKLDETMVPSIITEDFARKVFLIGKSLNFIRYGCADSAWVEAYSKDASRELRYGDTATLETSIDQAYKTTMERLIHLMDDKFKFFEHLNALKKYLLLGQGDFIALLMESLAPNLDRPAGSQYRHTLTAQLEHAIRSSNAQYESPDVLRRIDARLLEFSHGDIGWDLFTLDYKVDAPVDVIITPWANKQYLTVFNFLWRVKRVEYALGTTWRRCMTGSRGVLASVDDKLGRDWKVVRCCIAEMIHFINQLQYYILFEVIEASWDQLQASIHKPGCTLDDLISAHTNYLKAVTHKGLLGSSARSSSSSSTHSREDSFMSQLHEMFKIMLTYKDAVDGLYSVSVAEFTRRQEQAAKVETRTAQGKWGATDRDADTDDLHSPSPTSLASDSNHPRDRARKAASHLNTTNAQLLSRDTDSPFPISAAAIAAGLAGSSGDDQMLPALRSRLRDLSHDFVTRVNVLLGDLLTQPDVDMKFLGVVMNFNDVYHPKRRRRGGDAHRDRERKTPAASVATAAGQGAGKGSGADAISVAGAGAGGGGKGVRPEEKKAVK